MGRLVLSMTVPSFDRPTLRTPAALVYAPARAAAAVLVETPVVDVNDGSKGLTQGIACEGGMPYCAPLLIVGTAYLK